jgi:hypothetical protein
LPRPLLTLFLLPLATSVVVAQSTGEAATSMATAPLAQQHSEWPEYQQQAGTLDLVTITEPAIRNKCRVHTITADSITCGHGMGRKPIVYRRDTVAALINPPDQSSRNAVIYQSIVAAAWIAGSFFVPIAPVVILLRVLAGLSPLVSYLTVIINDIDHPHDILLYQRPNTPLTIHLH